MSIFFVHAAIAAFTALGVVALFDYFVLALIAISIFIAMAIVFDCFFLEGVLVQTVFNFLFGIKG